MNPGYIIAAVTAVAFVAIGIWAFTEGRRILWPEGRLNRGAYAGRHVRLYVERKVATTIDEKMLALRCAVAVAVTRAAWVMVMGGKPYWDSREICVRILSDESFDAQFPEAVGYASYQTSVPRRIGRSGIPMLVIRERHRVRIVEHGQPVIHEALHACDNSWKEYTHETESVWKRDGAGSVEATAERQFEHYLLNA